MRGEMFICILARSARTQANLFVSLISSYTIFLSISSAAGDFTVGLLIPLNDAADIGGDIKAGKYYASAISVAVDRINQQPDLLPGHNISFIWNDTACDEEKTLQALIYQIYDAKVSAVIGPGCTCNTSARNAAAFNIPMISYMCSSPELSNKNLYSTFVRTYTQTTKIANSLILLFREFEWNKVAILYENTSYWQNVKDDMTRHFEKNGIEVLFEERLISTERYVTRTEGTAALFTNIMRRVKRQARIVVLAATYFLATGFLTVAYKEELTNGEFVFVMFELDHEEVLLNAKNTGNWFSLSIDQPDPYVRCRFQEAFASVLLISLKIEGSQRRTGKFLDEVQRRSPDPPFYSKAYEGYIFDDASFGPRNQTTPPRFAAFLYDAVYQYAVALNRTLENNEEPNGKNIVAKLVNKEYDSIIGHKVYIDKNGDAEVDLTLFQARWNYSKENCPANVKNSAVMVSVGEFIIDYDNQNNLQQTFQLNPYQKVTWPAGKAPKDSPECGFNGDKCNDASETVVNDKEVAIIAGVSGIAVVLLLLFLANSLRQYRLEKELKSLLWKIEFCDLNFGQANSLPSAVTTSHELPESQQTNEESLSLLDSSKNVYNGFNYTRFGYFKGTPVVVKRVGVKSVDLTRAILVEMKQMLDVRHDNLAHFIGATVDPPNICIVSEFYSRGSLQEILENMEVKLDHMFISSLVNDIVKGVAHLHSTDIKSHGSLKSSNCLVDSRWVLKIADYGLSAFRSKRNKAYVPDGTHHKELLWTAPEILRMSNPPVNGTQKGDVYSFAIILQEFHTRKGPYGADYIRPEDVIRRVTVAEIPPFRPTVVNLITRVEELRELMKHCWVENPEERPDFQEIKKVMHRILCNSSMKTNIFDNMVYMMEKYADNLEDLVSERTVQLEEEKRKTDALLDRILPRPVAEQLKKGKAVEAESFQEVSIYFSDIVGFTSFSSESTPMQVVTFLNDLYTLFDDIISEFEVYKVETIGDAYMVVSGLPIRNGHNHAAEIAHMALHLTEAVKKTFKVRHRPNYETKLRVGIHSGPVVAAVVGNTMPRYCLFGDTVNTASRMESNGEALKIHISEATKSILEPLGGFVIEERGDTYLKGKGTMKTYWLIDYLHKTPIRNRRSLKRNKGLSETSSGFLGISDAQPPSPLFGLSRSSSLRRTMKAISESPKAKKKQLVETDLAGLPVCQTTV